jgi:hypothetical protein
MDRLSDLHQTLNLAASLLDRCAGQIRDAALSPTKEHIHSIGEALVCIYDIQRAIYKLRPELEPQYDEPPPDIQKGNRRLGDALIAAYELADNGQLQEAISMLAAFASIEPSELHRSLAEGEIDRLRENYGP